MANGLSPRALLCALVPLCVGCSSDAASDPSAGASAAGAHSAAGASAGANSSPGSAGSGAGAAAGAPSAGSSGSAGTPGNAANAGAGQSATAPPPVAGHSIYALECHGESKDCNQGAVPCFGVSSPTPNVAAGWACANRCTSNADCSDAPSGAEARASCVPFASAGHCVLVCRNENQSFACPQGMNCYVPAQSPIGYCLW